MAPQIMINAFLCYLDKRVSMGVQLPFRENVYLPLIVFYITHLLNIATKLCYTTVCTDQNVWK